jgi:cytochrome c553
MKRYLFFLAATLLALAVIGGVVMASGIVPIKASSGHWPITEWILHFAMKRSVDTHSKHIDPPPLDSEFLVIQGAGHYDVGCYGCHGGPGASQPSIALRMTPHPPDLVKRVEEYDAAELFYIVRHGVKFTGMPAWASNHRDDEVWAVVAFLQRLPAMNRSQYEQLSGRALSIQAQAALRMPVGGPAGAPPSEGVSSPHLESPAGQSQSTATQLPGGLDAAAPPAIVLQRCVACHGLDGHGRKAHPQLAGQRPEYLTASLRAYRTAQRHSGIMQPIAYGLSDEEIREAVEYYSALAPFQPAPPRRPEAIDRGQTIAMVGLPKQRVGSCVDCHGPGNFERAVRYPHLAGQHAHYLVQQLHLFRSGDRAGTDHAHVMHTIAKSLTDEQIADLAAYYASESPGPAEQVGQ